MGVTSVFTLMDTIIYFVVADRTVVHAIGKNRGEVQMF